MLFFLKFNAYYLPHFAQITGAIVALKNIKISSSIDRRRGEMNTRLNVWNMITLVALASVVICSLENEVGLHSRNRNFFWNRLMNDIF